MLESNIAIFCIIGPPRFKTKRWWLHSGRSSPSILIDKPTTTEIIDNLKMKFFDASSYCKKLANFFLMISNRNQNNSTLWPTRIAVFEARRPLIVPPVKVNLNSFSCWFSFEFVSCRILGTFETLSIPAKLNRSLVCFIDEGDAKSFIFHLNCASGIEAWIKQPWTRVTRFDLIYSCTFVFSNNNNNSTSAKRASSSILSSKFQHFKAS